MSISNQELNGGGPRAVASEEPAGGAINHPSHYNSGKIEVIDALEDWNLNFHLGNAVKYIARAEHKRNALEDLKKARWYLDREINRRQGDAAKQTPK